MNSADLWQLENNFWTGDAEYYRRHVSDAAVMVFPGMVLDKAASIANIGSAPRWTGVTLADRQLVPLSDGVIALQYRASARRAGDTAPYQTLATSVYVRRDDAWQLAVHQQTPSAVPV
jgi:hypothetical protein